jgi:hypothetical protein
VIPDYVVDRLSYSVQGRWFLEHGHVFSVSEARQGRWGLGKCHSNARWLARRWPEHYQWWTGYAAVPWGDHLDNHSWVRLTDGTHVEVTYFEPSSFYIGVPVPGTFFGCVCGGHPNDCLPFRELGNCSVKSHHPCLGLASVPMSHHQIDGSAPRAEERKAL